MCKVDEYVYSTLWKLFLGFKEVIVAPDIHIILFCKKTVIVCKTRISTFMKRKLKKLDNHTKINNIE